LVMDSVSTALILAAGWLIGATGIGGILVVPALVQFEGVAVQRGIAAAALAFALPGLVALWSARGSFAGGSALGLTALLVGAIPGAAIGALLVHQVNPQFLLAMLGGLALVSGAWSLRSRASNESRSQIVSAPVLAALGLVVGLGSALTGTGGPVLLVPMLMLIRHPLDETVVAGQAIQLPVALCSSAVHWTTAGIDLRLAGLLGVLLTAGALAGRWCGLRMPALGLRRLVSTLLLVVGVWFLSRAVE
jgi:uncharacterized protein